MYSINAHQLVSYSEREINDQHENCLNNLLQEKKNNYEYNGILSKNAKRQIIKKVNNYTLLRRYIREIVKDCRGKYQVAYRRFKVLHKVRNISLRVFKEISSNKLVFITLTLSEKQKHDDKFIKREMLNNFLIQLKSATNSKFSVWTAERQKNGNIHFHLIFDRYVLKEKVQSIWNRIQKKHGYLDNYYMNHKRWNAPSTHICKIPDTNIAVNYIVKYAAKGLKEVETKNKIDKKQVVKFKKISGRCSGMSDALMACCGMKMENVDVYSKTVDFINKVSSIFEGDYFTVYSLDLWDYNNLCLELLDVVIRTVDKNIDSS